MYSVSKMRSLLSARFSPPTDPLRSSRPRTILLPVGVDRGEGPRSIRRAPTCLCPKWRPCVLPSRSCTLGSSAVDEGSGVVADGRGEIHVIVGPMFAGKTTELLRRVQAESRRGRNVAVIKSSKDDRFGLDSVVTHDGMKMPCWALSELSTFRGKFGHEAYEKLDVIGIDEAQFFGDLYDFCVSAADHDGKSVIVAGLDGDYLRRSFGSVIDVIPSADSVTKLTARCEVCGRHAPFTLRKTEQTKLEVVGGADVYMPVCRQHYVDGQVVIKAARHVLESRQDQCDSFFEVVQQTRIFPVPSREANSTPSSGRCKESLTLCINCQSFAAFDSDYKTYYMDKFYT